MRIVTVVVALTLVQAAHAAVELKAGVARVEITPSRSMQMYGYANRKCGPSNGTHDPLFAKALVLEAGARLAIVTMDLGSMVSDNLRRDVASKLNIPGTALIKNRKELQISDSLPGNYEIMRFSSKVEAKPQQDVKVS